ncbi:hypothetical protein [Pantoea sp. JK]|uniref:hypothetical protein n=1 Tax=Pantoea sp. JK TaxID=2871703 RepID=UPI002237DCE8|nr:hypothetical protein [Pantoea sp. JK]MCW6031601.1 hypothetical protein [Pantoea sp. JK]
MAFRADEAAQAGFEKAYRYLLPEGANADQRRLIRDKLEEMVSICGPIVEGYPAWHPFLIETDAANWSPMTPNNSPSFKNLDHTIYFVNGMLTCPYGHGVNELLDSINNLQHSAAFFSAVKLSNIVMYHQNAVPILIRCMWHSSILDDDGTISSRAAIGLMLEREIPNWKNGIYCESWEDMRGQFLGYPHGARSSLFVNQHTGQLMKNMWNQIIKTGILGVPR